MSYIFVSRKTSDKLDEQELIDIVSSSDEETKDKDESNHGSDKVSLKAKIT